MDTDLSTHVNIGKDTEAKLLEAGICSFKELEAIGSEQAFLRLQAFDPGACLHLLYALDGAVQGIKKKDLPHGRKQALQLFYKQVKK
jgi:DNA transformation protein